MFWPLWLVQMEKSNGKLVSLTLEAVRNTKSPAVFYLTQDLPGIVDRRSSGSERNFPIGHCLELDSP